MPDQSLGPWYKNTYVLFMIFIVMVETMFLVLQAIKSYSTKSVDDLSLPAYYVFMFTGLMWLLWGVHERDVPLILSGTLQSTGSAIILAAIYSYRT